ncbi:YcjF family protein [Shewanella marisflavi]|uniref:TIGR01620 family protein n=1 Tax=Shewanella marisflavi TaxID=260364 RepID=UPI00200C65DE|nr:TIGR01620 family protein [Shewanella marisflavi]MCL1042176.1 YcjF family protein [Shewanella marisflavi]
MNKPDLQIEKKQVFDEPQLTGETELKAARRFDGEVTLDDQESEQTLNALVPELDGIAPQAHSRKKSWSWLAKGSILGIGLVFVVELLLTLRQAWFESPLLFALYGTVTSVVGLWACVIAIKEWRQLKRLRSVEEAQAVSERLSVSMQRGEADKFIDKIISALPGEIDTQRYYRLVREEHNDAERLLLFETSVLPQLDAKAKKLVHRYASESALLLAASPIAVLDMAIILWRNQKMIAQLASCYGIELGYWSRIKLIRSVITNIIYAGTSEVVTDIGTQLFSLEVSGKVSARLAQGLGGGLLTARLGYQTMRLCRPVVFTPETKPKLSKIHTALLGELKDFSLSVLGKTTVRNKDFTSK